MIMYNYLPLNLTSFERNINLEKETYQYIYLTFKDYFYKA